MTLIQRSFAKTTKKAAQKSAELANFGDFWFGDTIQVWDRHKEPCSDQRMNLWWNGESTWEKQIKQYYEQELTKPQKEGIDAVLIYSQMPRILYRGTSKMFEYDPQALELSKRMLPNIKKIPCFEALFVLFPLMHSEDFMDVDLCVREMVQLHFNTKSRGHRASERVLETQLGKMKLHLDVVSNFGRYPQRNEMLERESTPAELEFLKSTKNVSGLGL